MRMRVRLTFNSQWQSILTNVAKQCGMTVDEYCERAVMLLTKQGIEDGARLAQEGLAQNGFESAANNHNTEVLNGSIDSISGDTETASGETQSSVSTDSATLSDKANSDIGKEV